MPTCVFLRHADVFALSIKYNGEKKMDINLCYTEAPRLSVLFLFDVQFTRLFKKILTNNTDSIICFIYLV